MFPISVSDSHVVGDTSQPLWEETIGAHLARVAATWPEHAALIVPQQNVRLNWCELDAAVTGSPPVCSDWASNPGSASASGR
jgi:hypothetical protein